MGQVGPATGVSTLWGQDAPGTCMGNQGPILAVPALGVCPSDAPPGAGGRDKATCTQVGPQTSTVTSFRACLKGMGVGTGASLSQKTFDALGILCPREALSVLGAGLGLVTQTVPWMLRTTPQAPSWCVEAGTGRVSVRRSVWGRQVSWSQLGGGGRASPLIHSRSCSHSWAPLPGGRRQHRSGWGAAPWSSDLRPAGSSAPAAQGLPSVPRASVPGPQGHSQVGGWRGSLSFACWPPQGAGVQVPGEAEGSHGAPSPAQCGLACHAHPERGLQPGAGGPGSVHVTPAVVPPWPLQAPVGDGASTQTSILMWFVLGRLLFSGLCLFKDALEEFQPVCRS